MSKPPRSSLLLAISLLCACNAPPPNTAPQARAATTSSADAPAGQASSKPQPTEAGASSDRKEIGAAVEEMTRDLEKSWCTSPPKPACAAIHAFASGRVPDWPKGPTFTVGADADTGKQFSV